MLLSFVVVTESNITVSASARTVTDTHVGMKREVAFYIRNTQGNRIVAGPSTPRPTPISPRRLALSLAPHAARHTDQRP